MPFGIKSNCMPPKIVAIVGPIRSGKTTTSEHLVARYGYRLASNSEVLREIASKLGIEADRSNLKRLGDALFSTLGNDLLAHFRIKQGGFPIVVDGVRYVEELSAYRSEPSFRLLGLTATNEMRYLRATALAHERKDVNLSREQFDALAVARSEAHVDQLLREADYVIDNSSSIGDLTRAIDGLIEEWAEAAEH
jgi:dephospho-CoA kinase